MVYTSIYYDIYIINAIFLYISNGVSNLSLIPAILILILVIGIGIFLILLELQ